MSSLFGPNGAQDDKHIHQYFIANKAPERRIVSGPWGCGKTSILIHKSAELVEYLYGDLVFDEFRERNWYIEEGDLNVISISNLFERMSGDKAKRLGLLFQMWETEIIRRTVLQLDELYQKSPDLFISDAWGELKISSFREKLPRGIWKSIKDILEVLSDDSLWTRTSLKVISLIEELLSEEHYKNINLCIQELEQNHLPTPFVAIEPIETPFSQAEETESLSEEILSALLNCWYMKFRPDKFGNKIRVYISIPWHRYSRKNLNFPHRINENVHKVEWTKDSLRNLIETRMVWEAKRQNKTNPPAIEVGNAWSTYFSSSVINETCEILENRIEDSFDYILRHTCWRPRDVLTLTRECISHHCKKENIPENLFFRRSDKVSDRYIKEAVKDAASVIVEARMDEFEKAYPLYPPVKELLQSMSSPINFSDFEIWCANKLQDANEEVLRGLTNSLWDADIIGVAIEFSVEQNAAGISHRNGPNVVKPIYGVSRFEVPIDTVAFLFKYSAPDLFDTQYFLNEFGDSARIIIHPLFHERLSIRLEPLYPVGA